MKKVFVIIVIILLILIGVKIYNEKKTISNEDMVISSLNDLFPVDSKEYKYKINGEEKKVKVNVDKSDITTITMIYDENGITVNKIYKIVDSKITEEIKYYQDEKEVSIEYPSEILSSFPYEGLKYTSVDKQINYQITSMKNNRITIEAVKTITDYVDNKAVEKEYKEIRVFEKGKGLTLYKTEYNGNTNIIMELK